MPYSGAIGQPVEVECSDRSVQVTRDNIPVLLKELDWETVWARCFIFRQFEDRFFYFSQGDRICKGS
jgi:hypothetical protein